MENIAKASNSNIKKSLKEYTNKELFEIYRDTKDIEVRN